MTASHEQRLCDGGDARFTTTHWSVVLQARSPPAASAERALAQLCQNYWYPLYAYVRRRGHAPPEAEDLTQDFFGRLLEKGSLQQVDRRRGKFRTFLLSSLDHVLANEWDKRRTLKRGGRCLFVSWDALHAEERYRREPFHDITAEKLYDRRWAMMVIERAIDALRREYESRQELQLFELLQPNLSAETRVEPLQEVAARLQLTEAAVKMRIHRLRRRFGELLRAEVAQTVSQPQELEEEMQHLLTVWD